MKLRFWLADLISGGELSHRAELLAINTSSIQQLLICWAESKNGEAIAWGAARNLKMKLARIAALETPNANATVRKMARIAKGEL